MFSHLSYHEFCFKITEKLSRMRLDQALSFHPEILTRSKSTNLIRKGLVTLLNQEGEKKGVNQIGEKKELKNRKVFPLRSSKKTIQGEVYKIFLPLKKALSLNAFDYPLEILMEDEDLIVLNKPSGLVVHPSSKHEDETLVNALIHHGKELSVGLGRENRPGIVHRLDRETSGLLVVAKNDKAHVHLADQFKRRVVSRKYLALVYGDVSSDEGVFFSYIKRHPKNRKKFINFKFQHFLNLDSNSTDDFLNQNLKNVVQANHSSYGKWAMTHYKKISKSSLGVSLLECRLKTGRTHQIRVHSSRAGFPILGDSLYGDKGFFNGISSFELRNTISSLNRIGLHACHLGFTHPRSHKFISFKLNWPETLFPLLKVLDFKLKSLIFLCSLNLF